MQLDQNFFVLFDLAESFHLDLHQLSERYRNLQKEVHPDRYAHASEREQMLAVQYAAHLNEALNTLKVPLKRAQYLLKLRGRELSPEAGGPIDPLFLMQQMELRERLEAASQHPDPESELEQLQAEVEGSWDDLLNQFVQALESDSEQGLDQATESVRKLQFLDKLLHEIEQAEDQLTDY
ncbi:Fe-S protein assembly co-chaperone HscB [Motiliproteus sp. MSK22-1]|uniref:Fe-S protein assembly co-chaperone HscB n=1 Tax=Motiliproteus sp. MSK22-1 TaxID=1897630 RepID=UPI0009787D24|nr:Fe-S protein assembly co-chaperone HscB [Motiliproteus sp. MSK22-1]OMH31831.1 Fe-S protein assembly co-chaperone HscB [Motiliproteus sp. MSK22-1]